MANRARLLTLACVSIAFGVLEAAVVTYLRLSLDPGGRLFPAVALPGSLLAIELTREIATLVLLGAVAVLAARDATERFAAFLFLFGIWDLTYYAALRVMLQWPSDLRQWDLLFLLPVRWLGPVYAPVTVATTMMLAGALALRHASRQGTFKISRHHAGLAALGALVILSSFVRPSTWTTIEPQPKRFPAERLLLGEALGIAAFVDAWRRNRAARAPAAEAPTSFDAPQF